MPLFTPYGPMFQKMFSNIADGTQPAINGNGTVLTANASAHTKATSYTELLSGTTLTEDCFAIELYFNNGAASAAARSFMIDLAIDPANGGSYTDYVSNLFIGPTGTYSIANASAF